jgi:hypothetical protein
MKNNTKTKTIDIKRWLEKSLSIEKVSIERVDSNLIGIIESHGFKIKNHSKSKDSSSIEAIYGTKKRAFSIALIPFIGKHFPAGKRFLLKAKLTAGDSISLDISITPYMELIDSEEFGNVITQSIPEKASDEFVAARKMFFILRRLYTSLNLSLPKELSELDSKSFAQDTFWGILVFYLESYSSSKLIYTTSEKAPWCWGAFLTPEFWFMWHEMWGASALLGFPTGLFAHYERFGWPHIYIKYAVIIMIILCRIIAGLKGNRIFFARYGYFPHEKQYKVPEDGPKWNWGAFIIPEFWFMWNEIIGISFIALAIDAALFFYLVNYLDNFLLSVTVLFFIRIIFGLRGNKHYYAKYGAWPGQKKSNQAVQLKSNQRG